MAAMRREPVDYPPCSIYFNGNLNIGKYRCSNTLDRILLARELGVDPFIGIGMPFGMDPAVTTTTCTETADNGQTPILRQTWNTPAGPIAMAIRKQEACRDWTRIHWGDESAGAIHQPLVRHPGDLEPLALLIRPASEADYARWHDTIRPVTELAAAHEIPIVATYGQGLATIMFTLGAEASVLFALDHPDAFEQFADIIHRAELRNIEFAARAGIPILKRFGGYEQCNFYNPEIFKRVCAPRLKAEVECAHAHGRLIFYRIVTGMEPLLDIIAGLGFDCIEGGEPCLSHCSLERWHAAFSGKAASWTGISTPVLLGGKDPEAVRREVRHGMEVFGRTGFILGVTNSIRAHFPWENTLAMVDEWKKLR